MQNDNQEDESYQDKFQVYDSELESGIFNLVVSLCQQKSLEVGMEEAKAQVADWLERIVNGLRTEETEQRF